MDGDGGGMDVGGMDGGTVRGVGSTVDEDPSNSGSAVLQSMGYSNGGVGARRTDENSTNPKRSVLKSIIIMAIGAFFVFSLVYFLLSGILALFGIQL